MSGATNWATALGGFLGGGEDAYNKATILQRAKTQQDLENEQKQQAMARAIVNDKRSEEHDQRMELLADQQNKSLDESRKFNEGATMLDRYGSGVATPEMLQSIPPAMRALATQKLPDAGIMAQGVNGQPVDQSVTMFKPSESEKSRVAAQNVAAANARAQAQQEFNNRKLQQDHETALARIQAAGANGTPLQVRGADGKPVFMRPSQAVGMEPWSAQNELAAAKAAAGRPATGADRTALGYFNRMLEAEKNARGVEDSIGSKDLSIQGNAPNMFQNWLLSADGQKYLQAQRTFSEARLRKESGAVIKDEEYDKDRQTNFRTLNDTPESLAQKRASRVTLLRGLGNASGPAFKEYYGDEPLDKLLLQFNNPQQMAGDAAKDPAKQPGTASVNFNFDPATGELRP